MVLQLHRRGIALTYMVEGRNITMLKPTIKLLLAGLLAAGLILPGVATALAQDEPPATPEPVLPPVVSSPEQPLSYSDQWVDIQPGEWHWYAFKFDFDDSTDDEQGPATIRLDTQPVGGATLTLLNREQVRAWQDGEGLEGFGAATPATNRVEEKQSRSAFCNIYPNDPVCTGVPDHSGSMCENLRDPASTGTACRYTTTEPRGYSTWSGVIGSSGTYYILVRGDSRTTGPIQYKFTTGGEGLTMK
jgi:hypothetical protein